MLVNRLRDQVHPSHSAVCTKTQKLQKLVKKGEALDVPQQLSASTGRYCNLKEDMQKRNNY